MVQENGNGLECFENNGHCTKEDIMIQENENGLECFEKNDHCTACLTRKYPVELEWQLPGADIIFQDTKVGEEVVVVIPSLTVTQLVQCEMPHACKF